MNQRLDDAAVVAAYARWAPVYDPIFGVITGSAIRATMREVNALAPSNVLEVGVGTGIALPLYKRDHRITGIDLSPDMLARAEKRVNEGRLQNVAALVEMDAAHLTFLDESFDVAVAMFVMTVVPEPEVVMRELARVTKPGGEVMMVNHFSQREGMRGWVERRMAPFADKIGWRSVFDISRVTVCDDLELVERKALRPLGLFTMLRFAKRAEAGRRPSLAAE